MSTRFAVATHILTVLALHPDQPVPSDLAAKSAGTSAAVVRQLLMRLKKAALVDAKVGPGGGSLLAKAPSEIRLLDVYDAVEDTAIFPLHRGEPSCACPVGRHIQPVLCGTIRRAEQAMRDELAKVTLQDVAVDLIQREAG